MADAAEKALAERAKQVANYHRAVAAAWREAIAAEPELEKLATAIRRCNDPDEMIELAEWGNIFPGYDHLILGLIDRRIQTIRLRSGLPIIDDPMAGKDADDCFQICRKILG